MKGTCNDMNSLFFSLFTEDSLSLYAGQSLASLKLVLLFKQVSYSNPICRLISDNKS